MESISVFIVDDHKLFREGVKFALNKSEGFEIVGEAANGSEFIDAISKITPHVVLMDIDMPVMNGFNATKKALELKPELNILILSMYADQGHYLKMIRLGAKGFILKDSGTDDLKKALIEISKGNNFFSQELLMNIILKKDNSPVGEELIKKLRISKREYEVLKLICRAFSNKQIADKLFISPKTVEGHKTSLMQKTETQNSVALVLYAIKNQLVSL
ncbi:MAG: response regulator transcription factor [Prolixibacteraceae bacterium]|nr:response regulator transcription factor [Prolixibacteraceae bacterium]